MTERELIRWPRLAILLGGLALTALFIPFTLAHGPTSVNEEHVIAGIDMHGWGFAMGVVPNMLIGVGLWGCRNPLAGGNRTAYIALSTICVALFASAAADLAWQALGPPFSVFVLAPAAAVASWKMPPTPARGWLAGASLCWWVGMALALIPMETQDEFGGYRITGMAMYAGVGFMWAGLGAALLRLGNFAGR